MQPYIKAMTWAFWRERRFVFILFILMSIAFSMLVRRFNPIFEKYGPTDVITVLAITIELLHLCILIIAGLGSSVMHIKIPDHIFIKPVSSRFLVMMYLILSILIAVLIHLAAVVIYRFIGHLDWPVITPLICLISIIICAYASFWSFSDTPFLCVIITTLICGFMFIPFMEFVVQRQVSLQYFLFNIMPYLLIVDIIALIISFKAVKHARYGEKLRSAGFWELIYIKLKNLIPGKNWKLNTPQKAYFWLTFRSGGMIIPALNILFILISFLIFIFVPAAEKSLEVFACIKVFGFINLFMLPIFGTFMFHQEDMTHGISYQIATRPISDCSIITTILKVFATCYSIGWIIYLIGFSIILLLLKAMGHFELTENVLTDINHIKSFLSFPLILLIPLGIWAAAGLFGSVFMTGRKRIIALFIAIFFNTPIIITLLFAFTGETFKYIFISTLIWLLLIVSIGGTILAMIYAIRRHLISIRFVLFLFAAYVSFCIIILLLINLSFFVKPGIVIFLFGTMTLPFAPFATAPLALYWNRHR